MQGCTAIKNDYHVCGRRTVQAQGIPDHVHLCGTHLPVYRNNSERAGHVEAGRCQKFLTTGRWCTHAAIDGELVCGTHLRLREERHLRDQQGAARKQRIRTMLRVFINAGRPGVPWRNIMRAIFNQIPDPDDDIRYDVAKAFYRRLFWGAGHLGQFNAYWNWLRDGEQGADPTLVVVPPAPPPVPDLGQIANDTQSVHTAPVSRQTNAGTEKLLAATVPNNQQTEKSIMRGWLSVSGNTVGWNDMLRVANDVNKWFNTPTCRAHNDNLYRRLLRGLVATINRSDDEMRPELYKRLWEECREATGMCCEGHISRLCNVMVGFDDAFQPQVYLGELMQQKMAAIASLDASEEEKRRQATAWFDEMAVPAAERAAWLDAF